MKPTLVLLPGLLCDKALWQHQINALGAYVDVIVPDLTGHDSMPELAKTVLSMAPDSFALAGLSMGGYVAMELMRQAPQRITQLALIDTSARPDTDESRRKRRGLIQLAQKGDFKGVTPRLLPMLIAASRLQDEELTKLIIDMAGRVGMHAFLNQQKAILGRIDSRPHLSLITVPTTIICGEQDALTSPEHAQEMANFIKGAELHIIPGAGHLAPLEQPAPVNKILKKWLGISEK
ncbi:MAG: alpha/beta hydrolase [Alphaproteobacteria bacterium]|nr:alpha/beta hydrolase [Alphaproteobacteria bacterium]